MPDTVTGIQGIQQESEIASYGSSSNKHNNTGDIKRSIEEIT